MSNLKSTIINTLIEQIDEKLSYLNNHSKDLNDALTSETKSTAGDKHDTSRAMIHLEQEKIQHQFSKIQQQRYQLLNFKEITSTEIIGLGNIILTPQNTFLLGVGLGKQVLNGKVVFCIGAETPLAAQLLGKKVKDEFYFNGKTEVIESIL